jgi:nucleotide-binding universal stress UspA family protein
MYKLISVPLDGTTESRYALPLAVRIGKRASCPLELIRVTSPPALGTELYGAALLQERAIDEMQREAEEQLRAAAAEVERIGVRVTAVTIAGGATSATLAGHLHQSKPDLVVMTSHDRNRLEHLLLGSVSESVVRHAHVPVLLLRSGDGEPELDRPPEIRRVLIPLDGSAFAEEIVPHATELANLLGADVTLVTVLDPVLATAAAGSAVEGEGILEVPGAGDGTSLDTDLLERAAEPLRAQGLIVKTAALVDRQPARAIVDYAMHHAVDIIAMTTHGRGALKRLVAGSVSEKVLRSWSGAMLMYRPELR